MIAMASDYKTCDGCEKSVPIRKRNYQTGLCFDCQKVAIVYFDIAHQFTGAAVMVKKALGRGLYQSQHVPDWEYMTVAGRVRRLLSAVKIPANYSAVEVEHGLILREEFPTLAFMNWGPIPEKEAEVVEAPYVPPPPAPSEISPDDIHKNKQSGDFF